jgi:hypothetical protein
MGSDFNDLGLTQVQKGLYLRFANKKASENAKTEQ